MKNFYQTQLVTITKIANEASNSKLFTIKRPRGFDFQSGQFVEVSLPGFGEAPISICSNPQDKDFFQICVRDVGQLTRALHKFKIGAKIGIRGPYGRGFPIDLAKKQNILIVAGGLGIEPVRPFLGQVHKNPNDFQKVQFFYGAKTSDDLLFKKDLTKWKKSSDLHISLDCPPEYRIKLQCEIGVVTKLFDKCPVIENAVAFLCGPPIMYKFVIQKLKECQFADQDIYLSLERRMHCGVGVCQHSAIGPYYVCKDGPVFSWEQIKDIKGVI